ncbi:hypothetical protein RTH46_12915 [Pseudomonas sp. zfem004]|uniref:hypothetical protein n=1 Tax=Pseudomonas sp. zfem004 TaxID=3078199 RepID=UPI0029286F02|nr:hypothetical protein [Pseudomonas sp. zfem004]MDU9403386.1 hypothetical protein [Pseudomonas sp. zfem004]
MPSLAKLSLFGGFRQSFNAAVNPLGNVAHGVPQQQAGVVNISDFRCSFRANVAELELADPTGQDLVAGSDCLLHSFISGIVPSMAKHGRRDLFA